MKFLGIFLSVFFYCHLLEASMGRLQEYPFLGEASIKENEDPIKMLFRSTACQMKKHKVNQSGSENQEVNACFINFSSLKDKKKYILNYIKDPKNWTKKNIHPSLYKQYDKENYKLKVEVEKDFLIIYSEAKRIYQIKTILLNSKESICKPLSKSQVKADRLPQDHFFEQGCFIKIQDHRFHKTGSLHDFFNSFIIDRIFKEENFKSQFLSAKNFKNLYTNFFEFKKIIIYSSDFSKTDLKETENLEEKTKEDGIFYIHIIKTKDLKTKMESAILKQAQKTSSKLKLMDIKQNKIQENQLFSKGAKILVEDSEFQNNKELHRYFDRNQFDKIFNDRIFKEKFLEAFNRNRQRDDIYIKDKSIFYADLKADGIFEIHILEFQNKIEDIHSRKKRQSNPYSNKELKQLLLDELDERKCIWIKKKENFIYSIPQSLLISKICLIMITKEEFRKNKKIKSLLEEEESRSHLFADDFFKNEWISRINKKNLSKFTKEDIIVSYFNKVDGLFMVNLIGVLEKKEKKLENILLSMENPMDRKELEWEDLEKNNYYVQGFSIIIDANRFKQDNQLEELYTENQIDKIINQTAVKKKLIDQLHKSQTYKEHNFGEIEEENTHLISKILKNGNVEVSLLETSTDKRKVIEKRIMHDIHFKEALDRLKFKNNLRWDLLPKGSIVHKYIVYKTGDERLIQEGAPFRDIYNQRDLDEILNNQEFKSKLIREVNRKNSQNKLDMFNLDKTIVYSKILNEEEKEELKDKEEGSFYVFFLDIKIIQKE